MAVSIDGSAVNKKEEHSTQNAAEPAASESTHVEEAGSVRNKTTKRNKWLIEWQPDAPPPVLPETLEDYPTARQLSETASEFLKRCLPLGSAALGPHLMVHDPSCKPVSNSFINGRGGLEFTRRTGELMRDHHIMFHEMLRNTRSEARLQKKLETLQARLTEKVTDVAREEGVLGGRVSFMLHEAFHADALQWMLFLEEGQVLDIWKTVVERVLEGSLGTGANLATGSSNRGSYVLLCISTKDWTDKEDVRRVLNEIVRLGLHRPESNGIFYKCDFVYYLNIYSNQKRIYGIKPSMYSSKKMLREYEELSGGQEPVSKGTVNEDVNVRRVLTDKKG